MADTVRCHCCLLELPDDKAVPFLSMNTAFRVDDTRSVCYLAAYLGLNQWSSDKVPDCKLYICPGCIIQLENAYTFRELCRLTEEWRSAPSPPAEKSKPPEQRKPKKFGFKCPQCKEVSPSQVNFMAHRLMHKSVKLASGAYRCTQCQTVFKFAGNFRVHFRKFHPLKIRKASKSTDPTVKRKCPKCAKHFSPRYLNEHLKSVHQNVRNPCKFCTRVFTFSNNLRTHMKQKHASENHHKERPMPPPKITTKNNNIPEEKYKYKCQMCPKRFTSEKGHADHVRAIHQKKPWKCAMCPLLFKYNSNLHRHKKRCHKDIMLNPNIN